MSRVHGKDLSSLTLNAQSLLTDTISLSWQASAQTHDTTTLGDDWLESLAGLKGGDDITHELFYDNSATTGSWAFVTALLGSTATTLSFSDGVRTVAHSALVTGVSLPVNVADMMKFTATYKMTGAVTFS